jgi:hypothetical protein
LKVLNGQFKYKGYYLMTMKNSFSQNATPTTPVIGNVTGSTMPQANAPQAEPTPVAYELDTVQLFEKAFTLAISQGHDFHSSANFFIEVDEVDTYQSVLITTGEKNDVVFYARRLNNASSPSQKHKVLCLRPGKWAEYFMETYCPSALAKNFEKFEDADVDYAANDVVESPKEAVAESADSVKVEATSSSDQTPS